MCWALRRAGEDDGRIASKLRISPDDVTDAIRDFEAARAQASIDVLDMVINTEAMRALDDAGETLREARKATRFTGAYIKGQPVFHPDYQIAMDAIKTASEMAAQTRPKGGGVAVNVGINNGGGRDGNSLGTVKTFEQRVREKRGVLADGDVKFLSDGKNQEQVIEGDLLDDDESADDDSEIIDDMADGTSDLEIEEAGEARD